MPKSLDSPAGRGAIAFGLLLPRPTGELSAKLTEGVFSSAEAPSVRFAATSPADAGEDKNQAAHQTRRGPPNCAVIAQWRACLAPSRLYLQGHHATGLNATDTASRHNTLIW
jgi:hypothetical protein